MGRVIVVSMDHELARESMAHWATTMPITEDEEFPQVFICSFMFSHVCYSFDKQLGVLDGLDVRNPGDDRHITATEMEVFAEGYLAGKLKWTGVSEKAGAKHIESELAEGSTLLVGSTYPEWLGHVEVDRLVLLTTSNVAGCAGCTAVINAYNVMVAVTVAKADVFDFATMDCAFNDPPADVELFSYPKIVYYAQGSTAPISIKFSELHLLIARTMLEKTGLAMRYRPNLELNGVVQTTKA
jgi:hypothetical protein